jgi:hypothetical protein
VPLRSSESGFIVGMTKALRFSEEFALGKILRMRTDFRSTAALNGSRNRVCQDGRGLISARVASL